MILNTGTPRSIPGHIVSGGVAGLLLASYMNYKEYKDGKISQEKALKNTLAAGAQGAVITACAIGVANALGDNTKGGFVLLLESSAYLCAGVAGIYLIDTLKDEKKAIKK